MKYQIHTERLFLTLIAESDLLDIHNLHSLPETDQYNTLGIPKNTEETAQIISGWMLQSKETVKPCHVFKVRVAESNTFIGLAALQLGPEKYKSAEVWYKYLPDYWNKGYATEVLKGMLRFGFTNLHLHRIEAGCAIANIGSVHTMKKSGMVHEGQKRKVLPLKTGWSDTFEYAILSEDYFNQDIGINTKNG